MKGSSRIPILSKVSEEKILSKMNLIDLEHLIAWFANYILVLRRVEEVPSGLRGRLIEMFGESWEKLGEPGWNVLGENSAACSVWVNVKS